MMKTLQSSLTNLQMLCLGPRDAGGPHDLGPGGRPVVHSGVHMHHTGNDAVALDAKLAIGGAVGHLSKSRDGYERDVYRQFTSSGGSGPGISGGEGEGCLM